MGDTLQWALKDVSFEDGSALSADWKEIYRSEEWHWQYDTHELSFSIYKYDGQYWKLYRLRYVPEGTDDYVHTFGGQACRMAQVAYKRRAKSPHSARLMQRDDTEWVRTYEVDSAIHEVLKAGRADPKYGVPHGRAAVTAAVQAGR